MGKGEILQFLGYQSLGCSCVFGEGDLTNTVCHLLGETLKYTVGCTIPSLQWAYGTVCGAGMCGLNVPSTPDSLAIFS